MNTKKSRLPVILTFIVICIIIYLFMNIKQTEIVCEKDFLFDSNIELYESVNIKLDSKKIVGIDLDKRITLPDGIDRREEKIVGIQNSIDTTLSYLDKAVEYKKFDDGLNVNISVHNNELVLLGNISFYDNNGELGIKINPNTKSSDVITLSVGDNYTDGELMKKLKNNGYRCK